MFVRLETCVRIEKGDVPWSLPNPPVGQGHQLYVCIKKTIIASTYCRPNFTGNDRGMSILFKKFGGAQINIYRNIKVDIDLVIKLIAFCLMLEIL